MACIRVYKSLAYIAIAMVVHSTAPFLAPSIFAEAATPPRTPVLFVGMQHFVSRANVYNVNVGNVLTRKRQAEIVSISRALACFRPTIVVVERTHGTSMLSEHYRQYLRGRFILPPDEPYQIGFRVAKLSKLREIHDIDYFNDFPAKAVVDYANDHGQRALLDASDQIYRREIPTNVPCSRTALWPTCCDTSTNPPSYWTMQRPICMKIASETRPIRLGGPWLRTGMLAICAFSRT